MTIPKLTFKKVQVLYFLERGYSYKQIAAIVGIHEATVRLHVNEIAKGLPCADTHPARDGVLLYIDRLLEENADVMTNVLDLIRTRRTDAA